jgi:CubicO group peptidase (beta-lactamase class C family)
MRVSSIGLAMVAFLMSTGCSPPATASAGLGRSGPGQVAPAAGNKASADSTAATVQRIETYLDRLEAVGFQGAVLVELNGREALARGYGYADAEARIRNTPETVFDILSLTKQFTAAAILKLQMQGRLQLGDSLGRYFAQVPADKAGITIHDLLRHRSGLPSTVGGDYDPISEADFIARAMSAPLQSPPGQSFAYSNVGYSLLGLIIEKASGMEYEAYLYEHLLRPAGMERTGYSRPGFTPEQVAVGHRQNGQAWGRPTGQPWAGGAPYWHLKAGGGLLSNVRDMYAWHRALQTNAVLSEEATRRMYHPSLHDQDDQRHYYAYGWDVMRTRRDTRVAWHNGVNRYFYSDFHRYLDEGISVIMFSNRVHPNFERVAPEIVRMILEPGYAPLVPLGDNAANRQFTAELIDVASVQGARAAKLRYDARPRGVDVLEFVLRGSGFELMDQGKPAAAVAVFELNLHANPNSSRAMQALAEGYMETGQTELAIRYFEACLALDPENGFASRMLARLRP